MSLAAGTRLGPYEIASPLGAGGMGEVYLARDTRLAREVAIKILPASLAGTAEARARFEREARAVSSLNHPHICTLYDVGRENGIDFLVLEKIEGETLAARVSRGPLPVDQVLRLGAQIADALDRAHRGGLVHRDLKPGNVMIAKSGAKLMDFGLARPAGLPAGAAGSMADTLSASEAQPVTAKGTIIGTFQYMAPEQLEGKEADARSDLWALGCVLYEMSTGKRAFEGTSQASLISAIMSGEPPRMSQLAPMMPPALDRTVRACLAKDPQERIQSAHDVKLQLQWIADGDSSANGSMPAGSGWRAKVILGATAVALVGLSILATLTLVRPQPSREVERFLVGIPTNQLSVGTPRMSPDGRTLAFFSRDSSGKAPIWLRPMDAIEARPIPGTEPAQSAIWSPDNRSLAFIADHKLQRVPAAGGAVVPIADVRGNHVDGTWGRSGVLLLDGFQGDSMIAVPATGGAAKPASRIDRARGDIGHFTPRFLPDGRHFLFVAFRQLGGKTSGAIMLGRLGSLEAKELGPCMSDMDFAPPDQVLYMSGTTLVTQTLDLARSRLTGNPVPLAEGLHPQANGLFSTGGGVLALVNQTGGSSELVWTDRAGNRLSRVGEPDRYREVELSPDGRRAALSIEDPATGEEDVWVRDLDRGVSTRLTFDRTQETSPVWSADGSRVYYSSERQGGFYAVYSISASGGGSEDTLAVGLAGHEGPTSASADGKWLAILSSKGSAMEDWDVLIRDTQDKEPPRRFCGSPSIEFSGEFSPDGRWLAYCSDETGREEIYVRSFPDGLHKWRVSGNGGTFPGWSRNGREIFYVDLLNDLVAVSVSPGPNFRPGKPLTLFHADLTRVGWPGRRWAVTTDGQRFLLNQALKNPLRGITITKNWLSAIGHRP